MITLAVLRSRSSSKRQQGLRQLAAQSDPAHLLPSAPRVVLHRHLLSTSGTTASGVHSFIGMERPRVATGRHYTQRVFYCKQRRLMYRSPSVTRELKTRNIKCTS